ncbi:MAG: hypothetical protein ACJA0Q_002057, partial [Saprospiraceae bacterium]
RRIELGIFLTPQGILLDPYFFYKDKLAHFSDT